ncbi:hypothetical protein [Kitasatospora griseola]|uniref:hypothetical protein n=1 Tax=Kitasatospora griseola TaxID=2064 RepID=UPI0016707AC1|nr:hypothetical protein [Kitasatospora griseola]GGQ67418.1 hypothetical protein GCM10010195_23780 [Kitasatospora griseola]
MNRRAAVALPLAAGAFALLTACGSAATGTPAVAVAAPPSASAPSADTTPSIAVAVTDTASALGEQGRGEFGDIYGSLSVDARHVVLYATDPVRARSMVEAAHRAHPDTAGVDVEIRACQYTARDQSRASAQVFAAQQRKPFSFPVFASGSSPDGTGIVVTTSEEGAKSPAFAREVQQAAGSVPVRVNAGSRVSAADPTALAPVASG